MESTSWNGIAIFGLCSLVEDKLLFLKQPIPAMPVPAVGQVLPPDALNTHSAWVKASKEIAGLMLMTMDPDIQKNLEHLGAYDMLKEEEGQSVSSYVLKMKSYIDNLERLGHAMTQNLSKNQKKKSHKAVKGKQGKGKAKMGYAPVHAPFFAPKPKNPSTPKKDNPAKDAICHQCGEVGHWRRNCPVYLAESMKKKKLSQGARTSGVEAIGEFHLCLPSGLVLILHNCHYAPSITRGINSVSHLYKDGFVKRFENDNSISVSRNNLIYFNAIPRDDIYEIDLSSSNTNDSSMCAIINKRAELSLDFTFLWHCRLRHISKKRIEKLQHDRLLNSTDIESFEKCVSCMSGKIARKPYSHQVERAKDLLGLIPPMYVVHLELCQDKEQATSSLSLKTLVVMVIQEFLDHLKEHGIIAHQTPPYKPQHNGVLERRNRTLLDMVRSMTSQTTLPKSFWDYAIESAARILNMVLTKKVDKTPYEVWHGQAPKLSYLKVWGCEALVKRDTLIKPGKLEPGSINGSLEDLEIIQEEDMHPSIDTVLNHEEDDQEINEPQSDINPIRKSSRTCRAPNRMCLHVDAEEHELKDLSEPTNYKAALLDPESDKWLDVMNVEMQSMKDNKVWDLVDLPPNGKTVGSKWLFKKKTDMDGAIHTFKARLVAKGFTQTYGVDYCNTHIKSQRSGIPLFGATS
ncbi:zinc finger, CCHC-type containing protein [Tanacetum coccineum]